MLAPVRIVLHPLGVDVVQQRYSTELIPVPDRLAYWRDAICAAFVKLDAQPVSRSAFSGTVDVQDWRALRLSRVTAGGQLVKRLRGEEAGDCLLSLQLHGVGTVTQAGRSAELRAGDIALYDAARPYALHFPSSFRQIVVQFPRQEMLDRDVDVDQQVARRSPGSAAMTAVTASLLDSMRQHGAGLSALDRERLSVQALDCIAAALSPARDAGVPAAERAGARRAAVLAYLARHAASPELTVERLASVFGMSARSMQRLFADDEDGLGDRIRALRLRRATSSMLAQPGITIGQVAAEHGYSDAAHFARAFRAQNGCSPVDFRRAQTPARVSEL